MTMRVFVTGATGFVGRALVRRLGQEGHRVTAWVRSPARAAVLLGEEVVLVPAGSEALEAGLAGTDAVVNLAGENVMGGRWTSARRSALVASRVGITTSLVAALDRVHPRPTTLVSASAVGWYGDAGDRRVQEDDAPADDFLAMLCRDWEAAARRAENLGIRVALPRFGMVLGRGGGTLSRLLPLTRLGLAGRMGTGRQVVAWIHLHDLVEVLVRALEDSRFRGPFHATAPHPVSNAELSRCLASVLGLPAGPPVPAFALRVALGDAASVLLGGQDARPERLLAWGVPFRFPSLKEALQDLVGRPVDPRA
jgi:hypothetical protein